MDLQKTLTITSKSVCAQSNCYQDQSVPSLTVSKDDRSLLHNQRRAQQKRACVYSEKLFHALSDVTTAIELQT